MSRTSPMVMEMLRAGAITDEDGGDYTPLDRLFARLEQGKSGTHCCQGTISDYHSGSAKTLKSIQITLAKKTLRSST